MVSRAPDSRQSGVPAMRGVLGHFMRSEEGRAFLVQVPGVNNAGLSDAQIAELTNWLVANDGGGFAAGPVAGVRRGRTAGAAGGATG
jgi:hypothetical protein